VLSINAIDVWYGRVQALHQVSIDIPEGKIITLLGANGAGKSTVLKALSGILPVPDGEIICEGRRIDNLPAEDIVAMGIIHVPEGRQIFVNLTVEENLKIGGYGRKDRYNMRDEMSRVLTYFPQLSTRLEQQGGTLSGGEQQMLAIARGLMGRPRVLLLDEPSLGLAPRIVADIFAIIRQLNREGTTVLLVEQNANMALKAADYAYVLETGRVVLAGAAAELLKDEKIKRSYLGGH
jgi:branched-chain amino acid transport system ATP-binding protein